MKVVIQPFSGLSPATALPVLILALLLSSAGAAEKSQSWHEERRPSQTQALSGVATNRVRGFGQLDDEKIQATDDRCKRYKFWDTKTCVSTVQDFKTAFESETAERVSVCGGTTLDLSDQSLSVDSLRITKTVICDNGDGDDAECTLTGGTVALGQESLTIRNTTVNVCGFTFQDIEDVSGSCSGACCTCVRMLEPASHELCSPPAVHSFSCLLNTWRIEQADGSSGAYVLITQTSHVLLNECRILDNDFGVVSSQSGC